MIRICSQSESGIKTVCITKANESAISNPQPSLSNGLVMIDRFELLQQDDYRNEKPQQNTNQCANSISLIGAVEPLT